jgi:uncharacterized C2H2 Zn-finger protein
LTTKKAKLACPECGKKYDTAKGLGGHRRAAHGVLGTASSSVATRLKKEAARLKKEGQPLTTLPPAVPVVTKPFKCPECGEGFEKTNLLGLHRRKHGISGSAPASRDAQQKRVAYLANYERDQNNNVICPECRKSFGEVSISMHRKMAHQLSASDQVAMFANKLQAITKIEADEPQTNGKINCPHCDYVATNQRGLYVHIGFKHQPSQSPTAIQRRLDRERKKLIEQPTQAIAIAETNGNITQHTEEAHPVASGYTIPDATLAVALGRFQGLCASFSAEFDLPPRSFATRLAELIYHSQIR